MKIQENIDADMVKFYFNDEVFEVLVGKFGLEKVKEALDSWFEDSNGNADDDYLKRFSDPKEVMHMLYLVENDLD
jgi:hypothetical protein